MSNPAVLQLVEKSINGQSFRIEDNIGEAVHIHFGNMRIDMSIKEFLLFADQIVEIFNQTINIEGIDVRNFNSIFLNEQNALLIGLTGCEIDYVNLNELLTEYTDELGRRKFHSIVHSRMMKAFSGDNKELLERSQYNYYNETNETRLNNILHSVKKNGYPYLNQYIILYNDGFYIRDGCHRASCLLYLYGNQKIPVLRLLGKNNYGTDDYILGRYEMEYIHPRERKDIIVSITKVVLDKLLMRKKVAIKGAGEHTHMIFKLLDHKNTDVKCILSKDIQEESMYGIAVITDADLNKFDVDTVLISSFRYRREMEGDISKLKGDYEVIDIYDYLYNLGIMLDKEFYKE